MFVVDCVFFMKRIADNVTFHDGVDGRRLGLLAVHGMRRKPFSRDLRARSRVLARAFFAHAAGNDFEFEQTAFERPVEKRRAA